MEGAFNGVNMAFTFALVTIAWIPFRAGNFSNAWYIFSHLLSGATHWLNFESASLQFRGTGVSLSYLVDAVVFSAVVFVYDLMDSRQGVWDSLKFKPRTLRWAVYYAVVIIVLFFGHYNQAQNFIYFQF